MDNEFFMSAGFPTPTLFEPYSSPMMSSWQELSSASGVEIQTSQLNSTIEQSSECVFNPSWENSTDQNVHFDSALSSMLSSPAASYSNISNENSVIRELIGKLGNTGNSGESSLHTQQPFFECHSAYTSTNNSVSNSCYGNPLNSPPKANLMTMNHLVKENFPKLPNSMPLNPTLAEFSANPGFSESTVKFSCSGSSRFNGRTSQFGMDNVELPYRSNSGMENRKRSRVLSSPLIKVLGSEMSIQEKKSPNSPLQSRTELTSFREESTVSDQKPTPIRESNSLNGDSNFRKRKAISMGKAEEETVFESSTPASKVAEANTYSAAKRCKLNHIEKEDNAIVKADKEKKENPRTSGDQKQTKANQKPPEPPKDYIHVRARRGQATDSHSLAERVRREKISERMKLLQDLVPGCNKVTGKAPMLDEIINYVQSLQLQVEFLSMKLASLNTRPNFNTYQPNNSMPHPILPIESSTSAFYAPQFPTYCEDDDLQTIAQMGFSKDTNQETALQSQSFEGSNKVHHMKVEL